MEITLENEELCVTVSHFGAELSGIENRKTGDQYIWNADARYWKRSAPVLFPIVGSLKDGSYAYQGKRYAMGQHGFARDREFSLVSKTEDTAWFSLCADEQTYEMYPFVFTLEIGYQLAGNVLRVSWRVVNEDEKEMYFSIGGHPAFMCPIGDHGEQTEYALAFDTSRDLTYAKLNANGLASGEKGVLPLEEGKTRIDAHLFDEDALIVEGGQAHAVSLCTPEGKPYVTVRFDAPLFGLWSPAGKHAPFVCIEPWYGRCDAADFAGTLETREYGQTLAPGECFETSYTIEIG